MGAEPPPIAASAPTAQRTSPNLSAPRWLRRACLRPRLPWGLPLMSSRAIAPWGPTAPLVGNIILKELFSHLIGDPLEAYPELITKTSGRERHNSACHNHTHNGNPNEDHLLGDEYKPLEFAFFANANSQQWKRETLSPTVDVRYCAGLAARSPATSETVICRSQ